MVNWLLTKHGSLFWMNTGWLHQGCCRGFAVHRLYSRPRRQRQRIKNGWSFPCWIRVVMWLIMVDSRSCNKVNIMVNNDHYCNGGYQCFIGLLVGRGISLGSRVEIGPGTKVVRIYCHTKQWDILGKYSFSGSYLLRIYPFINWEWKS